MNCPFCGSSQIVVANTRSTKSETQIWRRRKCLNCKSVFTSYEKIDLSCFVVEKRSGRRQRFNQAKLMSGIYKAMVEGKGVDRGEMAQRSEKMVEEIEEKIIDLKQKVINSIQILDLVMQTVGKKDLGAAIRYWSYFQKQGSLRELKKTLKKISTIDVNERL